MPRQENTPTQPTIEEDEIDLRELFATIGRYKRSIFFITFLITLITAVIAYRMPKYYKTTTVIEVKPKSGEREGFSLGAAGALLGLSGGGDDSSIAKDAALLEMYRDNEAVLGEINYGAQYYTYERFRYTEIPEENCSLSISSLKVSDYNKRGLEIAFEPVSDKSFRLLSIGRFFNSTLGTFLYDHPVQTEDFSLILHKRREGITPAKIKLNADKHFIFEKIISQNLSASADKKNPFITVEYLDTSPNRGERYLDGLIKNHIRQGIGFEIDDAQATIDSLESQITEFEKKVQYAAEHMEKFKSNNKILDPKSQAEALIRGKEKTAEQIIQYNYQLDLLDQLIGHISHNKNIDAIAPVLVELQDQPTLALVTRLQELELQAISLSQEFKPAYPKLKSLRSQIKNIKSRIKSNLRNLKKTMKARERSLKKRQQEYADKLQVAPTAEKELREIMRKFTLNEKLYTYLLQKRASAKLKRAEAISRFRTIEPIYTNPAPAKPKKALIVIVGFITALILSIFLAFFREFLRGSK